MATWQILEDPAPVPTRAPILVVANQKGGVGKTTTALNLAAALCERGRRVLVVDLDPQANLTTGLGLARSGGDPSSYELLLGEAPLSVVARPTSVSGLDCVRSSVDLAGAEVELVALPEREARLRFALGSPSYDLVLVDCPPSLGLLTVNALVAADRIIVPVQCEYYALEGLGQLLTNAERVRKAFNARLGIAGLLLTMYDARTKLSEDVAHQVRAHFGSAVFNTVIPRTVRLSEAPSYGEPIVTLDPSSRGAIAFRLLAAEVETRVTVASTGPPARPDLAPPATGAPRPNAPARPGPRGYGTTSPEPPGLDEAFPRPQPWGAQP